MMWLSLFAISACALAFEILLARSAITVFDVNYLPFFLAFATAGFAGGGLAYLGLSRIVGWSTRQWAMFCFGMMALLESATFLFMTDALVENFLSSYLIVASSTFLFFAPGIFVSRLATKFPNQIAKIYAVDLFGAAAGVGGTLLILQTTGRPFGTAVVMAFLFLGLVMAAPRRLRFLTAAVALGWSILCAPKMNQSLRCSTLSARGFKETRFENGYVQLNLLEGPGSLVIRSPKTELTPAELSRIPRGYLLGLDCAGRTMTYRTTGDAHAEDFFSKEIHSLPFLIRHFRNGAFLGAGLGMEVRRALHFGLERATAIEINPFLVQMERQLAGDQSVYGKSNVDVEIQDARRFMTETNQRFDLVYLSSVKHYGHIGENHLVTVVNRQMTLEAFESYWDHLTPDGALFVADTSDHARLNEASLRQVLKANHLPTRDHMIYMSDGPYSGHFLTKPAFSEKEKLALQMTAKAHGWLLSHESGSFRRDPITDDRPSIENVEFWRGSWKRFTPMTLFVDSVAFGIIAILFASAAVKKSRLLRPNFQFWILGVIFMGMEIAFIQNFSLILVRPIPAISVCVLTILGAGSLGACGYAAYGDRLRWVPLVLAGVFLADFATLDHLTHALFLQPFWLQSLVSVCVIAPPAFFVGVMYPQLMASYPVPGWRPLAIASGGVGNLAGAIFANLTIANFGISRLYLFMAALAVLCASLSVSGRSRFPQGLRAWRAARSGFVKTILRRPSQRITPSTST